MRILLTGGSGFIGTNFMKYIEERYPSYYVTSLAPYHSKNFINLFASNPNVKYVNASVEKETEIKEVFEQGFDIVVNFAAQSHVDQSIHDPGKFIRTNVVGTQMLLEMARKYEIRRFIQISTAEVYGPIEYERIVSETSYLAPVSPYSASKASSDLIALSYHQTYGMDVVVSRCTNNYGPFQKADKFIPLVITNALQNKPIPLYGDGNHVRDWLHVYDHCSAIDALIHGAKAGSIYNIASNCLSTTKEIIHCILGILDRPHSLIQYVSDRKGDHNRFTLSCEKIKSELFWKPKYSLTEGIQETVAWYQQNSEWWESKDLQQNIVDILT